MNSGREIAFNWVERLIAGERGDLPLRLAMLLEKSSPLRNSDEHYRKILPNELVSLELDAGTVDEITKILCTEISRNPDSDLLFAVSVTGSPEVTRLAVTLLAQPPRPLGPRESRQALGILSSYLPSSLTRDDQFLPSETREALIAVLHSLQYSEDVSVRGHAQRLLQQFTEL